MTVKNPVVLFMGLCKMHPFVFVLVLFGFLIVSTLFYLKLYLCVENNRIYELILS